MIEHCKARPGTCTDGKCCKDERRRAEDAQIAAGLRPPRPPREADIQQAIRLALGLEPGLVLFRNNIGATMHPGTSRPVHYGVGGKGGSDLIGLLTIEVSTPCDPDTSVHVCLGHVAKIARFVALEIKKPGGRVSADQWAFIELVRAHGGFAAIVFSVDEAREAIARARRGELG